MALEALCAGCPVITTGLGAVPELLRNGQDALVIAHASPGALAEAVLRLARDRELAARLAQTGGRHVRERFGPDQSLTGFRAVLEELLG